MRLHIRSAFLAIVLISSAFILSGTGCAKLKPDADPLVVRAEQFQKSAASTFDFVLNVEASNPVFYKQNIPKFYEFCEWLKDPVPWGGTNLQRVLVMQWNVQTVKRAYKVNKDSATLELALKVAESALTQASVWSTTFTNKPLITR